ncbi:MULTISPECIES: ABC transporter ATP-binding protein [Sporosarcina]|uniref:ABC transporter ATP-binding protein n=1 Tax=Sporosarcina contaminans TaxID=633403 RepID=A0ABW3U2B3_9BACL
MAEQAILQIDELKVGVVDGKKKTPIVNGVSFELKEGETLGIVGESGCGKSMTSLSLMGLLPKGIDYLDGHIHLGALNLENFSKKDWRDVRGKKMSMIFQEPMSSLNPVYTIRKQVREMIFSHEKISREEADARTLEMLKLVGIPRPDEVMDNYPHQLSGGMRQRVMIALALVNDPKILIADEPTTALDVTIQAQILELMKSLQKRLQMSIILITHDLGVVAEICDRVVVMYAGEIIEEATTKNLFDEPLHPYTKGLLASLPSIHEEKEYLSSIPGTVPAPGSIVKGCRFKERCPFAHDRCSEDPQMVPHSNGSKVRCWLYGEEEVH